MLPDDLEGIAEAPGNEPGEQDRRRRREEGAGFRCLKNDGGRGGERADTAYWEKASDSGRSVRPR